MPGQAVAGRKPAKVLAPTSPGALNLPVADYQNTELYHLLDEAIPPLQRLERAFEACDPAIVADMILHQPALVFIIDYYFRLLPPRIGGTVVSAPNFDLYAAVELFNCQMIRYYRATMFRSEHPEDYASLLESCWKAVRRARLTELFRHLLQSGKSNETGALLLLRNMDTDSLVFLQQRSEFQTPAMLRFFKDLGTGIQELIKENADLYDFIYRLASDLKDDEYVSFLDDFTLFMIQIRIARTMADDAAGLLEPDGSLSLKQCVGLLRHIPESCQPMALELLRQRGYIQASLIPGLLEALAAPPAQ